MEAITPLGWIAIIFIILFTILMNLVLVGLLRGRGQPPPKQPLRGQIAFNVRQFSSRLRSPFGEEQEQLQKLSTRLEKLREWDQAGERCDRSPGLGEDGPKEEAQK